MHLRDHSHGLIEEGRGVIVLLAALRVFVLKGELVVVEVAHIVRAEGARLIIHGVLKLLQLSQGIERDARQLEDARGVLGPYGLELGRERGLGLSRQGRRGLLAALDQKRSARRAGGDRGGCGGRLWRCLHDDDDVVVVACWLDFFFAAN